MKNILLMLVLILTGCVATISRESEESSQVVGKLMRKLVEKKVLTQKEVVELLSDRSIGVVDKPRIVLTEGNNTSVKPPSVPAQELEVVGSYERSVGDDILRMVFQEYGIFERYLNEENEGIEARWEIAKDGEIYVKDTDGNVSILKIIAEGDMMNIAWVIDGKRTDLPKERQYTAKKIK